MGEVSHEANPILDGATTAPLDPSSSVVVAPRIAQLGMGFDERTGRSFDLAVTGAVLPTELQTTWDLAVSIDYCDSYEALDKFFSMKASARYSGASGGASASVEATKSTVLTRTHVLLAVRARVLKKAERLTTTSLLKAPRDLLDQVGDGRMYLFAQRYGGSFVRSLYSGAELACTIEVSTATNETIEQLRVTAAAHGFGASGGVEVLNSLVEFNRTRSFKLRSWQTGGESSRSKNDGKVNPATAEQVIARVAAFMREMQRGAQLDALAMELSPMTSIADWPINLVRDPRKPYPPAIETMATTVNRIRDHKDIVDAVKLQPPSTGLSETARQAAVEFSNYLDLTVSEATARLEFLMSVPSTDMTCYLETFPQYRIRTMFKVRSRLHENSAPRWDANTMERGEFELLFGPKLLPIKPWPELEWKQDWGYHGEDSGAVPGVWLRCHPHERHDMVNDILKNYPDYQKPGKLIFGNESPHGAIWTRAIGGNTACYYTPLVVTTITVKEPERPILPTLPNEISAPIAEKPVPTLHAPAAMGDMRWRLAFDIDMGSGGTTGRFDLEITESPRDGGLELLPRTVLADSYWYKPRGGPLTLTYTHQCQDGWSVTGFAAYIGHAFALS